MGFLNSKNDMFYVCLGKTAFWFPQAKTKVDCDVSLLTGSLVW